MEFLTARGPQALFEKSLKFHKTQNEYGWGRTTCFVKILNGTGVLVYVALKFGSDFRSRIRPARVAGNRPVRDGFKSKVVIVEILLSGLTFLGPTSPETDLADFGGAGAAPPIRCKAEGWSEVRIVFHLRTHMQITQFRAVNPRGWSEV